MDYRKEYEKWLNDPALCAEGKAELKAIEGDEKAIEYRFGAEMEFGTAGMRGVIGYGTNMMKVTFTLCFRDPSSLRSSG